MMFLINPNKFNKVADYLFRPILVLSITLFSLGLLFSFYLSPDDYQQGSTVRIMYVHVPSAWLALLTYAIMTLYSIAALAFRIPFGFIIGPFTGAFIGAYMDEKDDMIKVLKIASGALIGFIGGLVLKLVVCAYLLYEFCLIITPYFESLLSILP